MAQPALVVHFGAGDGQTVTGERDDAASASPSPSPDGTASEQHKLAPRLSSTGAPLPTLQDYLSYVKLLYSPDCWRDAPSVPLTYDHLSYTLQVPLNEVTNPSVAKAAVDMFRKVTTTELRVFHDLTGHIPAGRMTLVLAPPGAGQQHARLCDIRSGCGKWCLR